jgi:DNA modification methylase
MTFIIAQADSQHIPLADESVQCVVTSPPYWGLRDYGVAGQLGLEPTPDAYVANLVAVFQEVRRVLRPDGTVWLNLGDSFASGKGTCYNPGGGKHSLGQERKAAGAHPLDRGNISTLTAIGLKPKDLVGIPWRVAFALQADGWWLRSDIIWQKPNPMPESVTDRPTKAHEYVFLLSKSARYYYDHEAVKEAAVKGAAGSRFDIGKTGDRDGGDRTQQGYRDRNGRNRRTVWSIATKPYSGAHFAVMPPALVEPCILAGTSERGCCPVCGASWKRVIEKGLTAHDGETASAYQSGTTANRLSLLRQAARERGGEYVNESRTLGWEPTCGHDAEPVPCTVLDPFAGSGTVGVVALRHGRRFVGLDLSRTYCEMALRRIVGDMPILYGNVEAATCERA